MSDTERLPPGSFGCPLIGETLSWLRDPYTFVNEHIEKYGSTFKSHLFGTPCVFLGGHEDFSLLHFYENFSRSQGFPKRLIALFGERTLGSIDGAEHCRNKRLYLSVFSGPPLDHYIPLMTPIIDQFIKRWHKLGEFDWYAELQDLNFLILYAILTGHVNLEMKDRTIKEAITTYGKGFFALPPPLELIEKLLKQELLFSITLKR